MVFGQLTNVCAVYDVEDLEALRDTVLYFVASLGIIVDTNLAGSASYYEPLYAPETRGILLLTHK